MKNSMKALFVTLVVVGMIGMLRAEETVTETANAVKMSGELSTAITFGDEATSFTYPNT